MRGPACLVLLLAGVGSVWGQGTGERGLPPASPCPNVYGYGWDPAGGWHGLITILPPPRFSEAQLVFRMTVPYYRPEAGVGRVEVKGGAAEVQAISRRAFRGESHKIQFMVMFPPFDELPRAKEIVINGKTFCSDTRVYPDTRSTIELKYVLRTGLALPVASGNDFSVVTNGNGNDGHHNHRPNKPDLVTVAILVPWDEARPIGSGPESPSRPIGSGQQPHRPIETGHHTTRPPPEAPTRPIGTGGSQSSRPIGSEVQSRPPIGSRPILPSPGPGTRPTTLGDDPIQASKPPCKCNKTGSRPQHKPQHDLMNNLAPQNHVFHSFQPDKPNSAATKDEQIEDLYDIFTTSKPGVGIPTGQNVHQGYQPHESPPNVANRPGQNTNHVTQRPGFAGSGAGTTIRGPTKEPDDKIYFVMADSDEVDSPRVVKLLEHLLVIAKKHYLVDLERLEIEKKRLALEKSPHYTLVTL